mmetsp:Transcript_48031/g.118893  ORF Transcript_48031/g.118893 Transcript_48031/m.118893 type:complete len:376 (+) Transcript_48031:111-1238(+)
MELTPRELNKLSNDVLSERVTTVLDSLCEPRSPEPVQLTKIASFVTANILERLHNLVQKARREHRTSWSKQAALAMVVASFTGITIRSKAEAEHIGNAQDSFVRHHTHLLKKAKQSLATAECKARKSGKDVGAGPKERIEELDQRVYKCTFGGVPRNVVIPGVERPKGMPVHNQAVPFMRIEFADEVNLQLKHELLEVCKREQAAVRERERETANLAALAEQHAISRKQAEQVMAKEVEARRAAEEQAAAAASKLLEEKRAAASKLRREKRAAEREVAEAEGKIARLGGQVASAHFEAARKSKEPGIRFICLEDATEDPAHGGFWMRLTEWNRFRTDGRRRRTRRATSAQSLERSTRISPMYFPNMEHNSPQFGN